MQEKDSIVCTLQMQPIGCWMDNRKQGKEAYFVKACTIFSNDKNIKQDLIRKRAS